MHGVGFHHAGMEYNDRRAVEELFTQGDLSVLREPIHRRCIRIYSITCCMTVSTSTLAMGVSVSRLISPQWNHDSCVGQSTGSSCNCQVNALLRWRHVPRLLCIASTADDWSSWTSTSTVLYQIRPACILFLIHAV